MNGPSINDADGRSSADLHCREMAARIDWAVRLRWFFVLASLAVAFLLPMVNEPLRAGKCFLWVGLALALTNFLAQRRLQALVVRSRAEAGTLRILCLVQVVGDYLALSVVAYALGSVETPVMFLLLPNCILAALYFPPLQSLAIALLGLGLVLLPLALEFVGLLAPVIIFTPGYREIIVSSPLILGSYLASLVCCVLFCWYLAVVIRRSLLANEEELETRYKQLLAVSRQKTSSVLHGAHELKAPLAAIRSYASTMRDGYTGPLPKKALQVVERIGVRCDRLLNMTSDIIRLGNLQGAVRVDEVFHPLALMPLLAELVAEATAAGQGREITVHLVPPDEEVWVLATEEHLRTLFLNLLLNAVQYSRPGGEVGVALALADNQVTVSVRDHGIGIGFAEVGLIFEEYYRTPAAVHHYGEGDGLGLAIVKAISTLLGAEIQVSSEVGNGTVVRVTFATVAAKVA